MKNVTQFSPSGRRLLTCVKQPIDTLATANVDLIAPPAAINGRTLVNEDRVLLTVQTDPDENGIYGFINSELERTPDWLNEEGQLVEVVHGTFAGQLRAFINGAWVNVGNAGTGPITYPTLAAVRADSQLLTTHASVYVTGHGMATWVVGASPSGDLGTELSSVIALPGDATGAYLFDQTSSDVKASVFGLSTVNVNLLALPGTIGGAALVVGSRYLLIAQTAPAENGTYVYDGAALRPTSDFAALPGQVVLVTGGTYAGRLYAVASASSYYPAGPGPFAYPSAAAVRSDSTLQVKHPDIYVDGLGMCVWRTFANGGNYAADTSTESTSFIALAGDNTGAYCVVNGQLYCKPTYIGTGAAWVTLLTIAEPTGNGDMLDISYAVRGGYGSVAWSFIRARGIVAVTRSSAVTSIAATGTTFSDPRIQVVYSAPNILIQAQQHATENWGFQADASVVRMVL